jgi:L-ribulose-5-phosphate 4-epimerase
MKAVYHAAVVEEIARMAFITLSVNPDTPRLSRSIVLKHFERKHGKNAYYGQSDVSDADRIVKARSGGPES